MRTPSPEKTHRPKDLCTIEQAEHIAKHRRQSSDRGVPLSVPPLVREAVGLGARVHHAVGLMFTSTTDLLRGELAIERARNADLQAKYDKLVQQMVSLKRKGYELPTEAKQGRVVQSGPSPEEAATRRMHDQMVEGIIETTAQQVAKTRGVSLAVARAEIESLRDAAMGGSITEPPI